MSVEKTPPDKEVQQLKPAASPATSPLSTLSVAKPPVVRIFSTPNLEVTHTQHGLELESELANILQTPTEEGNHDLKLSLNETKSNEADHDRASSTIPLRISAIETTQSKPSNPLCKFQKCTVKCSDRLTMQKTKLLLYLVPLSMLVSCVYVLYDKEGVGSITFEYIIVLLLLCYACSWCLCLMAMLLLEMILIIRDSIFWCVVSNWSFVEKKAFLQAYSGIDLMEEMMSQAQLIETYRMLLHQQERAKEEQDLLENPMMNRMNTIGSSFYSDTDGFTHDDDEYDDLELQKLQSMHSLNAEDGGMETAPQIAELPMNMTILDDENDATEIEEKQIAHILNPNVSNIFEDEEHSITQLSKMSVANSFPLPFNNSNKKSNSMKPKQVIANLQPRESNQSVIYKGTGLVPRTPQSVTDRVESTTVATPIPDASHSTLRHVLYAPQITPLPTQERNPDNDNVSYENTLHETEMKFTSSFSPHSDISQLSPNNTSSPQISTDDVDEHNNNNDNDIISAVKQLSIESDIPLPPINISIGPDEPNKSPNDLPTMGTSDSNNSTYSKTTTNLTVKLHQPSSPLMFSTIHESQAGYQKNQNNNDNNNNNNNLKKGHRTGGEWVSTDSIDPVTPIPNPVKPQFPSEKHSTQRTFHMNSNMRDEYGSPQTPNDDDDVDNDGDLDDDDDDDFEDEVGALSGENILDEHDIDDLLWGSSPEEREAFYYITHSQMSNACKFMYRCCPSYSMKFRFCWRMSCETCHILSILMTVFLFMIIMTFVTSNPILHVSPIGIKYVTEQFSTAEAKLEGYDGHEPEVIKSTSQTRDVLQYVINYEQSFTYSMQDKNSYYVRPENIENISRILANNANANSKNQKSMRVVGNAMSSAKVLNKELLIDLSDIPWNISISDNTSECISVNCVGSVSVSASMTVSDLNDYLFENGNYVIYGFDSFTDVTIGGALGSCSVGPLFNGKSIGYYLIEATLIDGSGTARTFNYHSNYTNASSLNQTIPGTHYLSAIRCNLGVLGVVYRVKFELFNNPMVQRFETEMYENDSKITDLFESYHKMYDSVELLIDAYSDTKRWTFWDIYDDTNNDTNNDESDSNSDVTYEFEESFVNDIVNPFSCVLNWPYHDLIHSTLENGKYHHCEKKSSLTYATVSANYFLSRTAYIVDWDDCDSAVEDAKKIANDVVDESIMLPITVSMIYESDLDRKSLIGYDLKDSCLISMELGPCSQSRNIFAKKFEDRIVSKYGGITHWAYLSYSNENNIDLTEFNEIRKELDPNNLFLNDLYWNLFVSNSSDVFESDLFNEVYPRNCSKIIALSWSLVIWFCLVFLLYLVGSYFRILPFMDSRNLCEYCAFSKETSDDNYCRICGINSKFNCCNDLDEMEEMIERDGNDLYDLKDLNGELNGELMDNDDLIDVDVLEESGEYKTITVTFRTAFLISMDDENNREWKYREKFAVSKQEELAIKFQELGETLMWQSIYPRQCLFFSAVTLCVAMFIMTFIQTVVK